MSIGQLAQSAIDLLTIGAWICFVVPILLLFFSHRHHMLWRDLSFTFRPTRLDLTFIAISVVSALLLLRLYY